MFLSHDVIRDLNSYLLIRPVGHLLLLNLLVFSSIRVLWIPSVPYNTNTLQALTGLTRIITWKLKIKNEQYQSSTWSLRIGYRYIQNIFNLERKCVTGSRESIISFKPKGLVFF